MSNRLTHFIGSLAALNDNKLADGVFRTFCKICYICWDINDEDFKFTAPGTYRELSRLLGMDRKKAWRHITKLKATSHIELRKHTDSVFQIRPNYSEPSRQRDSGRANVPTTTYDSTIIKEVNNMHSEVNEEKEVIKRSRANATEGNNLSQSREEGWRTSIDNEIFAFLTEHSIGDPARTKISLNAAITFEMVKGHVQYGELMGEPINYIVSRLLDKLPNPMMRICSLCAHKGPMHQTIMYQEEEDGRYIEAICPNSPMASERTRDAPDMINILNSERWDLANKFNAMLLQTDIDKRDNLYETPIGKAFEAIRNLDRFEGNFLELVVYDKEKQMIIIETLDEESSIKFIDLGIDTVIGEMLHDRLGETIQVRFEHEPPFGERD